jgi:hypothetical protein
MLDGQFGRLSTEATAEEVLTTLGEPQDFLRQRVGEGAWSVLWNYGALHVGFDQRWTHGLFVERLHYFLVEFEGGEVPAALGLGLAPLADATTLDEFEQLAREHDVDLRDVTPEALRGPQVVVAGRADVYASFHDGRLHAFGTPLGTGDPGGRR